MSTIFDTTMAPTKLELISAWLPRQPWYSGTGPDLSPAGGFRLDDPAGKVGIELIIVNDGDGTSYFVPLAYRGAALAGAEDGLLGTSAHGVLGTRWIYDAAHDPVAVAQLLAFVVDEVQSQHQSRRDTLDPSVGRAWSGADHPVAVLPLRVSQELSGHSTVAIEVGGSPASLDVLRVLPAAAPGSVIGHIEADWSRRDGTTERGPVVVVQ